MLQKRQVLSHKKGFTLIELIITLVVAGILGALLYTILSSQSRNSVESLLLIKENSDIVNAMEKLNGYYRSLIENDILDLVQFRDSIENIVHGVDPAISVSSKFILFDGSKREIDTEGKHKFLKVTLKKGDIVLTNLFSQ